MNESNQDALKLLFKIQSNSVSTLVSTFIEYNKKIIIEKKAFNNEKKGAIFSVVCLYGIVYYNFEDIEKTIINGSVFTAYFMILYLFKYLEHVIKLNELLSVRNNADLLSSALGIGHVNSIIHSNLSKDLDFYEYGSINRKEIFDECAEKMMERFNIKIDDEGGITVSDYKREYDFSKDI